jgi:hypothetical protein
MISFDDEKEGTKTEREYSVVDSVGSSILTGGERSKRAATMSCDKTSK